jgi:multisubunit Na+/H+ antiporter MnhF subunit
MLFKYILVALLLFVIISLFTAFYYLVKDPSSSKRVVKSLFLRVGLSLFIMILLLIGTQLGWVTPHGFGQ